MGVSRLEVWSFAMGASGTRNSQQHLRAPCGGIAEPLLPGAPRLRSSNRLLKAACSRCFSPGFAPCVLRFSDECNGACNLILQCSCPFVRLWALQVQPWPSTAKDGKARDKRQDEGEGNIEEEPSDFSTKPYRPKGPKKQSLRTVTLPFCSKE